MLTSPPPTLRSRFVRLTERLRPRMPWIVWQSWQELLFLHWKVDEADLRRLVPRELEIDRFDGQAWITLLPMHMVDVRVRGLPRATASSWPEINLRTYVRRGHRRGIYFLSIDAPSRLCLASGRALGLPMVHAPLRLHREGQWRVFGGGRPVSDRFPAAQLHVRYRPRGPVFHAEPDTLTSFHTDRELMFFERPGKGMHRMRVHHPPWPLQEVEAILDHNGYLDGLGIEALVGRGRRPDLMMYAGRADTIAWPMVRERPEDGAS